MRAQNDSAIKKTTFTLAAIYGNNTNYYGQTADEKMPYIALAANLKFKPGLYVTGLAYKVFTDSNLISATAAGLGYEFKIAKNLTGDINYTHTFFPKSSMFVQAGTPGVAGFQATYEWLLTSSANFDVAFGENTDYFITLSNYKAFNFSTKDENAIVGFTPQVDITAGTQQFYESYTVRKNNGKGNGKGNGNSNGQGNPNPPGQTITVTNQYQKFSIISYNLKLPVSYSRASYMFEAAYQASLLSDKVVVNPGKLNSFFTLGAYYQF